MGGELRRLLVIVDQWFDDSPGGMARVAADHARAASRHGWDVTVATIAPSADLEGAIELEGIRLIRLAVPNAVGGLGRLKAFGRSLAKALGEETWDLAHLHSAPLGRAALTVIGDQTPVVVTVHSPITDEMRINWSTGRAGAVRKAIGLPLIKAMERQILRRASVVHTLSEYTSQRLARLHGRPATTVMPHWVSDVDSLETARSNAAGLRNELGWPAESTVFFTARGHKPRVGLEDLIDAAAAVLRSGRAHLVIAGSGPLTPNLIERARRLGLAEAVSFPGRITEDELNKSYLASDLFVLPTRQLECFGLVTIEALSRGLPVLGSDAGATPEILGPISPEFLYPAGDVGALRAKLSDFLDGSLRPLGSHDLRTATHRIYGESIVVPQLLEMLDRAMSWGRSLA